MKKEEIPQDQENLNEGKLAKLYYVTDDEGHYTKGNSIGWEPETVAMRQAWEVVHEEVEKAREEVLEGKASPILYFMKKNIMTLSMVASYVGRPAFVTWLHLRPFFFNRLKRKMLDKYAFAFRVTVEELTDVKKLKKEG